MSKKTNKNYIEQESGRSMVEMLGVLAIIGVLSVGGISGYTSAINKHKANEILNAAAVRAMAVSTQLQSGVTDPTLGEFDSAEKIGGATFTGVDKVGDNQFKLTFGDKPSDAVLTQMQNIAGDNVGVDISRLLYNNDLSSPVTNTNNRDENDPTKCAVGYVLPDCDACAEGYEKQSDGTCIIPTPAHNCPSGATLEEGYTGSDALGDGKCKCSFSSEVNTCGGKGSGYYCDFSGAECDNGAPDNDGTCQPVSNLFSSTTAEQSQGHYYTKSPKYVNQWTAQSWCRGMGSTGLISFTTLSTLAGETIEDDSYYKEVEGGGPLYKKFCGTDTPTTCLPGAGYWTSEDYGGSSTSCGAYDVGVSSSLEFVLDDSRDYDLHSALCE